MERIMEFIETTTTTSDPQSKISRHRPIVALKQFWPLLRCSIQSYTQALDAQAKFAPIFGLDFFWTDEGDDVLLTPEGVLKMINACGYRAHRK